MSTVVPPPVSLELSPTVSATSTLVTSTLAGITVLDRVISSDSLTSLGISESSVGNSHSLLQHPTPRESFYSQTYCNNVPHSLTPVHMQKPYELVMSTVFGSFLADDNVSRRGDCESDRCEGVAVGDDDVFPYLALDSYSGWSVGVAGAYGGADSVHVAAASSSSPTGTFSFFDEDTLSVLRRVRMYILYIVSCYDCVIVLITCMS